LVELSGVEPLTS